MTEQKKTLPRGELAVTVRAHIAASDRPLSAREISDALGLGVGVIFALMRDWTKNCVVIRHGTQGRYGVQGCFSYTLGPHVPVALTYAKTLEDRAERHRMKQRLWRQKKMAGRRAEKEEAKRLRQIAEAAKPRPAAAVKTRTKIDTVRPAFANPAKQPPAQKHAETVEQFMARGGHVERIDGFQKAGIPRQVIVAYGRNY